ncbi:hypothetical protein YC2023_106055 [Brassica napus]
MRGCVEEIEKKNPKGASKQDIVSWRDKTHFPTLLKWTGARFKRINKTLKIEEFTHAHKAHKLNVTFITNLQRKAM